MAAVKATEPVSSLPPRRNSLDAWLQHAVGRTSGVTADGGHSSEARAKCRPASRPQKQPLPGFTPPVVWPRRAAVLRETVMIRGTPRQIRVETQDGELECLNALVREVREFDASRRNGAVDRQAKLQTVADEVERLRKERLHHDLQVFGWMDNNRRTIKVVKASLASKDPLHRMTPDQKRRALRSIEGAAAGSFLDGTFFEGRAVDAQVILDNLREF